MLRFRKHTAKQLWQSESGSAMLLIGLAFGIMVLAVGGTIDMARAQIVRERLQWAVDAAALAAARESTQAMREARAMDYFRANFAPGYMGTSGGNFQVSSVNTINGKGTGLRFRVNNLRMKSGFLGVGGALTGGGGGMNNIKISANAVVNTMPVGPHDIVLAVDVSGSMDWNDNSGNTCLYTGDPGCLPISPPGNERMTKAKQAMRSFVDEIRGGKGIRIGIVPWDQKVNAGGVALGKGANAPDRMVANVTHTGNAIEASNLTTYAGSSIIRPMTFLRENMTTITNRINALVTDGNTDGALGMWWAVEMLRDNNNRNWVNWSRPAPTKSIIFITDGINTRYWAGPDTGDASDTRFASICSNAKPGIRVYVVAFNLNGSQSEVVSARNMLRTCASTHKDCPSQGQNGKCYWNSPNGNAMRAAFEDIAKTMMTMRLVK